MDVFTKYLKSRGEKDKSANIPTIALDGVSYNLHVVASFSTLEANNVNTHYTFEYLSHFERMIIVPALIRMKLPDKFKREKNSFSCGLALA